MLTDYVVIDLEMTGLNAKTDRILEAGAARVRGNVVTATFSEIINPKRELSEKVISLTGITNEMAVQGKEMDATLMAFLDFIGEDILVGQNVIFDYSFLKQWAVNQTGKKISATGTEKRPCKSVQLFWDRACSCTPCTG